MNARSFPEKFQDRNRKDKKIVLSNDVVIATYGYAITAHKSQGSQWDTVYIGEVQKAFKEITEEKCARWIYTAVTRAAKKVVLSSDLKLQKKVWKVIDDEAAKYVVDAPVGKEPVEEKPSSAMMPKTSSRLSRNSRMRNQSMIRMNMTFLSARLLS